VDAWAVALILEDWRAKLEAVGYSSEDFAAELQLLACAYHHLKCDSQAGDSTVLLDLAMDLQATDGQVELDFGLVLQTLPPAPAFKSMVVQRLDSVRTEVS